MKTISVAQRLLAWLLLFVGLGAASAQKAQIRFVPEVLNVVAGGDNNRRGSDTSEGVAATNARLSAPFGVTVDSKGNIYFTDTSTGLVRRVAAADGTVTTVAGVSNGNGGGGGEEGGFSGEAVRRSLGVRPRAFDVTPGVGYQLSRPTAIAVGPDDAVYFTDSIDNLIYKLDGAGNLAVIAGTLGSSGYSPDGTVATQALLTTPNGVAVDSKANIYFTETGNNVVRRIDAASGQIVTVAGNTSLGDGYSGDGAAATAAQLAAPQGIALDSAGNLLIADTNNSAVRKVNLSTGVITTVVGSNGYGFSGDGGPAAAANLSNPVAVATDLAGDIFIADASNSVVRRVATDGTITTVAGVYSTFSFGVYGYGTPATSATINRLAGIAIDRSGSMVIAGVRNGLIYQVGPAALLDFGTQPLRSPGTLPLTVENDGSAALSFSGSGFGVAGNGFSATGAGANGCSAATTLAPGASCGIVVTFATQTTGAFTGTLNVTDNLGSQSISLVGTGVQPTPTVVLTVSPTSATAGDSVSLSASVTYSGGGVPTGTVKFTDSATGNTLASVLLNVSGNGATTVKLPPGTYAVIANYSGDNTYDTSSSDEQDLTIIAKPASATLTASATVASAGDSLSLNATVTGNSGTPTGNVQFTIDGIGVSTVALVAGKASATAKAPLPGQHSLQAVYLGDSQYGTAFSNVLPLTTHGAILQFSPGSATTIAGVPQDDLHYGFSGDGGPATAARFHTPNGVTVDAGGNVFIADEQNNVIRKVGTDGTITTVAGIPYAGSIYTTRFGGDGGLATNAYLDNPSSVAVDAAGNLYIADFSNNVVRKVNASDGIINTVAGNAAHGGGFNGTDGIATAMYLNNPIAVALDSAGNLYIADYGNHLLRKVDTSGQLTTIAGSYYQAHNSTPVDGSAATSVDLYHPMGVAVSRDGTVYVSDTDHGLVRKIVNGNLYFVAGSTGYAPEADGVAATASALSRPEGLAFDASGNLYIAENGSSVIRKVDGNGIITTAIGYLGQFSTSYYFFDPAGAPANTFQLVGPSSVAVDTAGNLYATDNFNQTIIRVGPSGILQFSPSSGANDPQTLTLFNAGDAPLTFNATPYTITGNYTVTAEGTSPCNFSTGLAAGASCTVAVRNAGAAGSTGKIVFSSNALGDATVLLKTLATVVQTSTVLTLSESTGNVGDNVLLFAQVAVSGAPAAGNVSFYDGTTLLGTSAISSGYAYLYISTLSAGKHMITASYQGGGVYAASTSDAQELDLTGTPTVTTLSVDKSSVTYGASVTFTAAVSTSGSVAVTSGSVTFAEGGTTLATRTVDANGNATFNTSSLSPGTHNVTATYVANGALQPSTSPAVTVTVAGGGGGGGNSFDYTMTLGGLPVVIRRGDTKMVRIILSPSNNTEGTVQLSCGTLPSYATCSFAPATVIVGGPFTYSTAVLTITTKPIVNGSSQSRSLALSLNDKTGAVNLAPVQH